MLNRLTSDGVSEGEFAVVEGIELGGMKGKSVLRFLMSRLTSLQRCCKKLM